MDKIKTHYKASLAYYEIAYYIKKYITLETVIICIGTDKCIGDALGPLVGTMLKDKNFPLPVYGTIDIPIHALNLDKNLKEIKKLHPNASILAIDASLGDEEAIGEIHCRDFSIHPGKGVGMKLPDVGEASIIGIVDSCDKAEFFASRTIRLSLIMNMARIITDGMLHGYYLALIHKNS